jgi:pilus assembly protein CpaD
MMKIISTMPSNGAVLKVLAVSCLAVGLMGCEMGAEERGRVAATTVLDPTERHPIMVSQQPSNLSLRVSRGSHGLTPHQKSQLAQFLDKYRAVDAGNSKIVVSVPSGAPNEVAAMRAVADMRDVFAHSGFSDASISVEPYHNDHDPQPPVRVQYLRYVAEGPECGRWSDKLSESPRNLAYENFGCAQQKNLASMIANPADLVGPRTMTPANADRRAIGFEKYVKGEATSSQRSSDEKASVKGN